MSKTHKGLEVSKTHVEVGYVRSIDADIKKIIVKSKQLILLLGRTTYCLLTMGKENGRKTKCLV